MTLKHTTFSHGGLTKKFTSLSEIGEKLGSNENQCLDKHETATFIEENTNTFPYFSPKMIYVRQFSVCNEERNMTVMLRCSLLNQFPPVKKISFL